MANYNLKRKRAPVSYREAVSDDETELDSEADYVEEEHRSSPRRKTRRTARPQPPPTSNLPIRSRRRRVPYYKELSSDEDTQGDYAEVRMPQPKARRPRFETDKGKSPTKGAGGKRRGRTFAHITPQNNTLKEAKARTKPLVTNDIIPTWTTLPYHVLLQVFVYASHPLYDDNLSPTSAVPWLLNMARMHTNFTKPALTALYRNPPIFMLDKERRSKMLQNLLDVDSKQLEDYRVMVKRLELDVSKMPHLNQTGRGEIDLGALIHPLKTLREIEIFDPHDRPPYRQPQTVRRAAGRHYPPEIFTALEQGNISLKSWTWNHFLCSDGVSSEGMLWMKETHGHKSFQTLRDLTLTNFPQESKCEHTKVKGPTQEEVEDKPTQEELLGSALAALPNLRTLSFVSSTVVNDKFLPLLPVTLVSLTMANCVMLTSEILGAYLSTHGNFLEDLILNHNQSLDMSFLPELKRSCPRLEVLKMDLNYYSVFATSRDADPKYDELLKEYEVPTWPSTLQVVDLVYLRKWTGPAAKTFFQSLIDSAEELPHLRELILRAMVDVNWRERAAFRDEWIPRFKKIFLARNTPPSDHLVSFRAFREWKATQVMSTEGLRSGTTTVNETSTPTTSTSHSEGMEDSDSDAPILPRGLRKRQTQKSESWGSKRLRSGVKESSSVKKVKPEVVEKHIQGRCRVVDIRIDNLRPREEVYSENDFLDSEPSGDEEWNGNVEAVDDEMSYAW